MVGCAWIGKSESGTRRCRRFRRRRVFLPRPSHGGPAGGQAAGQFDWQFPTSRRAQYHNCYTLSIFFILFRIKGTRLRHKERGGGSLWTFPGYFGATAAGGWGGMDSLAVRMGTHPKGAAVGAARRTDGTDRADDYRRPVGCWRREFARRRFAGASVAPPLRDPLDGARRQGADSGAFAGPGAGLERGPNADAIDGDCDGHRNPEQNQLNVHRICVHVENIHHCHKIATYL